MGTIRRARLDVLVLLLALVAPAVAQDDAATDAAKSGDRIRFTGEIRLRPETQANYLDFNDDGTYFEGDPPVEVDDQITFAPYRVRMGLEADITDSLLGLIELQVADVAGTDPSERSVLVSNSDPFDLYQAYIHWGSINGSNSNLRIGRQELVLGNGFLFGNQPYYNGISFDALRYLWTDGSVRFNFWYANTNETFAVDQDTDLWSMEIGKKNDQGGDVSFYAHWILDGDESGRAPRQDRNLLVVGFRWTKVDRPSAGPIWNLELAWQDGRVENVVPDPDEPDLEGDLYIGAWGGEGLFGWSFQPGSATHKVYLHAYYGSGDRDIGDRTDNNFNVLYQNIHDRLGRADIVQGSNVYNLGIAYEAMFGERHGLGVDVMAFRIARPFDASTQLAFPAGDFNGVGFAIPAGMFIDLPNADPNEDALGSELDLWYDYYYSKNLSFNFLLAYFVPGDAIAQINLNPDTFQRYDDPAYRAAVQARLRF